MPRTAIITKPKAKANIPTPLRFPLLVLLSLSMSSLLYSLSAPWIGLEMSGVSRHLERWEEVAGLGGWRIIELAIAYYAGYDSYESAALSVLSQGPFLYLLHTFYGISTSTVFANLAIATLSSSIPLSLLRRSSTTKRDPITTDASIHMITTLLGASIFATTLYTAYCTFLPRYLALYFEGLVSLSAVYSSSPFSLLPGALVLGEAARRFVFVPEVENGVGKERRLFDARTAGLGETVWWNLGGWGWGGRTRGVFGRTAAMMVVMGGNTFLQTWVTVEGVEVEGAGVYAGIWVLASAVVGGALGVVGAV